ncbi:MAG TPA: polyphenol oxidase family protein [Baekduia sp.]|uniref:polyphenol oxidase family protein n=1 Tax=Baekduia sp. TaxID=2600305 RepID=UPI002D78E982|nr:polyphenol oxidase family protein [Baekduia sp.]HET6506314.1 polyphenol oxidase family protein [Baekduia sp.]
MALDAIDLELPGARVRFTGRAGGVSAGPYASLNLGRWTDDDPAAVDENRRRAADRAPIAFARQVHGTRVVALDAAPSGSEIPDADGVVTRAHGVAAMVLTADCVPVALASADAVAMVHAGWKGLSGGVLEAGVAALRAAGPVHAAIGPAAGACCYEVGPEVAERFPGWALDGRLLDLKGVAARRLRAAGVAHVHDVGRCTMCEPDVFFSHRVSGGVTGRQGGIAWRS